MRERLLFFKNQNEGTASVTPYKDWFIIVVMMIIVGMVFVSVAMYLFTVVGSDENIKSERAGVSTLESVDKERLEEALRLFSQRESVFQELFKTPPRVIDPSL